MWDELKTIAYLQLSQSMDRLTSQPWARKSPFLISRQKKKSTAVLKKLPVFFLTFGRATSDDCYKSSILSFSSKFIISIFCIVFVVATEWSQRVQLQVTSGGDPGRIWWILNNLKMDCNLQWRRTLVTLAFFIFLFTLRWVLFDLWYSGVWIRGMKYLDTVSKD